METPGTRPIDAFSSNITKGVRKECTDCLRCANRKHLSGCEVPPLAASVH